MNQGKIKRELELLSPAANSEIAIEAIKHGADAVYIGPPTHGARKSASNSIEEIEKVTDFAHQYRAKVYATVNTIVYESEIKAVESLCWQLYRAGVDALIVQDMGILRMKLPPIALHASTQCDIRTPEKAKFLEEVGFSQLVLARELTLGEIKEITEVVTVPVETFVHGALCVCYSGRCHASFALNGRSANRGECAQICRYPFTLKDVDGNVLCKDKYLLSLKDFNASHNLKDLIEAGVSSFKIEGRLKEAGYVKNITALYHSQLENIIEADPDKYCRTSFGSVKLKFQPGAYKSFNRGFTNYFLEQRKPLKIASMLTPKSQGEPIKDLSSLNNGDGISFYDKNKNFTGVNINRIEDNRIFAARNIEIPKNTVLYRTSDVKWDKLMNSETAIRKISIRLDVDDVGVTAEDERGVKIRKRLPEIYEPAKQPQEYFKIFDKLGNTIYTLSDFKSTLDIWRFYRASDITALRRNLTELLNIGNKVTYKFALRRRENLEAKYPVDKLDYRDNVSNSLAEDFYREHGVRIIEKAAEVTGNLGPGDVVMTTRHCVLRELGLCRKEARKKDKISYPLYLDYAGGSFLLDFDCTSCEMKLIL